MNKLISGGLTPRKSYQNLLSGILIILFISGIFGAGCQPQPSSPFINTFVSIPLGNEKNVLNISKPLFLGHRIESFRLRVKFDNPCRTANWISGVTLSLKSGSTTWQEMTSLPSSAGSDGSFWTVQITGNKVWINIFSNGEVRFDGGSPAFQILEIERHFKAGSSRNDLPTTDLSNDTILYIPRGFEAIGFSPQVAEAQHYIIDTRSFGLLPQVLTVYVSPFLPEMWNDVGLFVAVSTNGFKPYDTDNWINPVSGDSGVYHEFFVPPNTNNVYVTIKTTLAAPYFLSVKNLRMVFTDIIMERDQDIGDPRGSDRQNLRDRTSRQFPYGTQFSYYLAENPSIDRRIREVMVLASANMLNSSDGYLRLGSAVLNRQIDWWRDVDVQFQEGSGRANASWTRINLFEDEELQNPITGGWTFLHEWGHWEYGMPDEYFDISGPPPTDYSVAIDPNSLMGTRATTEFCHSLNHYYSEDMGGTNESMWQLLVDQYLMSPPTNSGGLHIAKYYDVLHKLDDLFILTIY